MIRLLKSLLTSLSLVAVTLISPGGAFAIDGMGMTDLWRIGRRER